MVHVLIPTQPDDTHALYTKMALEKKGHEATLWYTADFPQQQRQTFKLSNNEKSWLFNGVNFYIHSDARFDTVWYRRARRPVLSDLIHEEDRENVANEMNMYYKNIWQMVARDAFWVNPIEKVNAANCKIKQLHTASEVGLSIPTTLISNHAEEIRRFIQSHKKGEVIYKTLFPVRWINNTDNTIHLTYTKPITISDLPSDKMLENTIGVFQTKIHKAYELRITYFGEYPMSAKIHSQSHPKAGMDWRCVPAKEIHIEPYVLPDVVHKKCISFMKKLGIVFGCFDFIVTPEGEYVFLEVNEQGQFLWIEEVNPEIKMLDAFTDFLIHSSPVFHYKNSDDGLSLADFSMKVDVLHKHTMRQHIHPITSC